MVEIYLVDHKGKTLQRIGMSDYDDGILGILQMLIDGMGEEQFDNDVALKHLESGKFLTGENLKKMREKYGLRKRTFDEKLKKIKTWKLKEV